MSKKPLNEVAAELNARLSENGCVAMSMLSAKGARAFFPSRGILGQSAEAKGTEINATIGTAKEDDGSPLCLECIEEMLNAPADAFLYAPSAGVADLRRAWRDGQVRKNPGLNGKRFSLPVVTHALTHALYLAGQLFLDKGDKLILPDLYWDNYELLFAEGCGAVFTPFKTFAGQKYNVPALRRKLLAAGEKKVLLLNFPNNPTGYTVTTDEAYAIRDAVRDAAEAGKKVVVFIDDAYFGLVYEEGVFPESVFSLLANLHENVMAVKMDGATKEDYVWGVRVGFITFGMKGLSDSQYSALEAKAAGLVRATISSASNIGQRMLLQAYGMDCYPAQKAEKFATLKNRYAIIRKIFADHPEYRASFTPMPFNSGYFMCVKPRGVDAEAVRKHLIAAYSTGTIVLSGLIRIAFSTVPCAKLPALFAHIHAAVRDLTSASSTTSK